MKKSVWPVLAVSLAFAVPAMAQNIEHQNRGVEPGTTSGTAAGTSSTAGNAVNHTGEPGRPGMPGTKSGPAASKSNQMGAPAATPPGQGARKAD